MVCHPRRRCFSLSCPKPFLKTVAIIVSIFGMEISHHTFRNATNARDNGNDDSSAYGLFTDNIINDIQILKINKAKDDARTASHFSC